MFPCYQYRSILLYHSSAENGFLYVAKNIDREYLILFGTHLKKVREGKNVSQAQLAIDCDFDVSVISRIERGAVNSSISNIRLIAGALGIEMKDLFDFKQ